jgi:acyl-CoA synthetase (AMP-forming)/AMP-acid ligase II
MGRAMTVMEDALTLEPALAEATPHPRYWAARTPAKPALILADRGEALTYGELVERSDRAAQLFASLGVVQGDTVAFLMENHIRYPELAWAAKNSGLRYVAISAHLNGADAGYILGDCGAKLLVASRKLGDMAAEAIAALKAPIAALMLDGVIAPFKCYEDLLAAQPATPLEGRLRGASMLYSSGTTGRPKGVKTEIGAVPPTVPPQRHGMVVGQYGFDDETVFITPAPFYHAGPLRFMMITQRCGGTVVGFEKFDPAATLAAIGRYRATHGFFVPTMFKRMLALPEAERRAADTTSMRHAIHAAAPCPVETKRAMIDWWGPVIDELYSGTEAVGHTFINSAEWLAHPGSVGRAAGNCRIKIVDEAGRLQPPGAPGRIMMSNGLKFAYHGDPAKTRAIHDDEGFASLGDIGYLDAEGFLYLTDRESHMIIAGGVNIYPQEAEAVLATHPDVEDVAVIGVPHPDMGEAVKAVVQPRDWPADPAALEAELIAFCRARLSLIKCPRSVDFARALPRNDMGKLVKHRLKAAYWKDAGRMI